MTTEQDARELYQSTPEFQEYQTAWDKYLALAELAGRAKYKTNTQLIRVNELRDKYVETAEYKAFKKKVTL
jgi:hypothetical protein